MDVVKDQIKNPEQLCFFIFIAINLILFVPFTFFSSAHIARINRSAPKDYEMPAIADFKACLPLAAAYTVMVQGLAVSLEPIFSGCAKNAHNPSEKA